MNYQSFKQYLNEAKQVGTIYHFTDLQSAWVILSDKELITDDSIDFSGFDGGFSLKRAREGVSFTRNKNLKMTANAGGRDGKSWGAVRIAFDGNKLSSKYKIEPYADTQNYISKKDDQQEEIIRKKKVKFSVGMVKSVDVWIDKHVKDDTNFDNWCAIPDECNQKKYIERSKEDGAAFIEFLKKEGYKSKIVKNFKGK